jgi:hypothetical protein
MEREYLLKVLGTLRLMPLDEKDQWHANMPNVRITARDFAIVISSRAYATKLRTRKF